MSRMFGTSSSSDVSLVECLNFYIKPEDMTGDNKAYCSKCKTHQKSTKKLEVFRFPEILVLHFKRFAYSKGTREKINTTVTFPLKSLDVSPCAAPESLSINKSLNYDLFAVSNHMGGLGGGHYTAHVRSENEWFTCNDSRVHPVSSGSIGGSSAYVLFYHRSQKD